MALTVTLNQFMLYFAVTVMCIVFPMYLGVAGTDHLEDRTLYDPARNILYNNPVGYFRACANGINYTNNVFQDLGTYCDNIDRNCASCYGPTFYCAAVAECSKFNAGRGFLVMAIVFGFAELIVLALWGWKLYKSDENSAVLRRIILAFFIIQTFCAMVSAAVITSVLSDSDNHITQNTPLVVYKVTKDDSFGGMEAALVLNFFGVAAYMYHLWTRREGRDFVQYDASSGQPLKLESNTMYQTEHL